MEDIHDIKGFMPMPHDWWWFWWVAALLCVAIIVFWFWKRKKPTIATEVAARLSASEIAMRALQQLREENPPVEIFYTRLADIIRYYIEGQFGLHAPERTTEEFLSEATLPPQHMTSLSSFLMEADLVKFARLRPGKDDVDRAYGAAECFINESRSMPVAATPACVCGNNAALADGSGAQQ
jgi:hypothetical protein